MGIAPVHSGCTGWGPVAWVPGVSTGQVCSWQSGLGDLQAPERGSQVCAAQALLAPSEHSIEMLLMLGTYSCWAGRAAARHARSSESASEPGHHLEPACPPR